MSRKNHSKPDFCIHRGAPMAMGAEVLQAQQLREDANEAEDSRATKANICERGLMSICLILTVSGVGLSIRLVGAAALCHDPQGPRHQIQIQP